MKSVICSFAKIVGEQIVSRNLVDRLTMTVLATEMIIIAYMTVIIGKMPILFGIGFAIAFMTGFYFVVLFGDDRI